MSKPKENRNLAVYEEIDLTVKFTFDAVETDEGIMGKISTPWYQPHAAETVCTLCNKKCKELGQPICYRVNPFCG